MTVPRKKGSCGEFNDCSKRKASLENLVTVPRKKGSSREFSDCSKKKR